MSIYMIYYRQFSAAKAKILLHTSTGKHVTVNFDVTDKISNVKLSKQQWKVQSLRSLYTAANGLKIKRVNYLRRVCNSLKYVS